MENNNFLSISGPFSYLSKMSKTPNGIKALCHYKISYDKFVQYVILALKKYTFVIFYLTLNEEMY